MIRYFTCYVSLAFLCFEAAFSHARVNAGDLVGDWACYGYEESGSGMYHADYSIIHAGDGSWRGEGQFGSMSDSTGGMPFEWDFDATGTWSVESDALVYSMGRIRFLPTMGGEDYEAADPKNYLRLPLNGAWRMDMPEPVFMTLEHEDGGLLIECDKQQFE